LTATRGGDTVADREKGGLKILYAVISSNLFAYFPNFSRIVFGSRA